MRYVRSSSSSSPALSFAALPARPCLADQPGALRLALQTRPLLPHQIQCEELVHDVRAFLSLAALDDLPAMSPLKR
jgi:hypothetical protein